MGLIRLGGQPERHKQDISGPELLARATPWAAKLQAFLEAGYKPHYWQLLAHTSTARFIVMGAGRRGGKTRSASFEFARLCDYRPQDGSTVQRTELAMRGVKLPPADEAVICCIVVPEYQPYARTRRDFFSALRKLGLEYEYNQTERTAFLPNKEEPECIVYIKGATDPDRMVGDGYCATWWDEPAAISGSEAWDAFGPALDDHRGCGIFSTTPGRDDSNWWYFDEMVDPARQGPETEYIEWYSIENPYFPEDSWQRARRKKHPIIFRREYMARWERGEGGLLKPAWLHHYNRKSDLVWTPEGQLDPERYAIFAGIDPAISLSASADFFVMAVLARDRRDGRGYLVDLLRDKLAFPDQLDAIERLERTWHPLYIGVDATAYQLALAQQAVRLASFPNILPVTTKGASKKERLLKLGPAFRNEQVLIPRSDEEISVWDEFESEWCDFPSGKHDDTLDAVDIAITAAGALMGDLADEERERNPDPRSVALNDPDEDDSSAYYDEYLGCEY